MSQQEFGYIQLPPDSTGKKSGASGRIVIDFENETTPFLVGDDVTGLTSGATAEVVGIERAGYPNGRGQLFLSAETSTGTFVVAEDLQVSLITYANVTATSPLNIIYYQKGAITDHDTPSRSLGIDERGAASVTFTEGQPSLSSFGGLITNEPTTIRQYVNTYDAIDPEFYSTSGVNGGYSYLSNERSVLLDTNVATSGSFVRRTSHFYHNYQAGTMTRLLTSSQCGDAGKTGVRRRWGLYDDNNGVFWELDGTTLYVVVRSSVTGTPIDTRVSQSNFNTDKLDGSIRFDIDVSKANLYWIDFQWLGVGIIRYGVYESDGTRTIAHVVQNANINNAPYMRQGTLPLRYEIENTNTAASSSELKFICAAVQGIGQTKTPLRSRSVSTSAPRTITAADGEVPILTLRPKTTVNGIQNTATCLIGSIDIHNSAASNLRVKVQNGTFPSGASFVSSGPNFFLEYDESASGDFYGVAVDNWIFFMGSGQSKEKSFLTEADKFQGDIGIILLGDGATQPGVSVTAESLSGEDTDVSVSINWKEIVQ